MSVKLLGNSFFTVEALVRNLMEEPSELKAIASKHTIVGRDNAMAWKDTHDTKTA
jgi:diaminopimelate epimerase